MTRIEELEEERKQLRIKIQTRNAMLKKARLKIKKLSYENEKNKTVVLDLLDDIESSLLEILSEQKYDNPSLDCLLMRVKKMAKNKRSS